MEKPNPRIVVIGGGTGSFTLLQALKKYTKNITALVNMADDGGSTGQLRDEFGVLPPGDIRQCLVALSESSEELRSLFNYRYPKGSSWEGHSFGNLFLSTVEMTTNDFAEAVRVASKVLNIRGKVVPMTLTDCKLCMEIDSQRIVGQYKIETTHFSGKNDSPKFWLEPDATISPEAKSAIVRADLIVIAPGNLYASLIPALLVSGVKEALSGASAQVVYVCNLINKPNHTAEFAVHDYVEELERVIGKGSIDTVLYNTDKPTVELLHKYALDGEFPVHIDEEILQGATYMSIGGNFLARKGADRDENDTFIHRSLIRHDAYAVADQIVKLYTQKH